ncbi:uncharacterized protein LOC124938534 isoform X2 [Impatiens glandulifera]|uniref:uncharacterized protein LOC124938534 isoform X2 n=1 Tax=Impatiens glandulifera TaxID=253017 RepID=UPI001FB0BBA7|nr:uncharacterized protein LOC124938534 isoform X2 [Impatiens glandulifera]
MGWSYEGISLDDFLKFVKGFVDILILASGYQSTGCLAHWDPENIKKAFQWSIFFEDVMRQLKCSDGYEDSIYELDTALSQIKSSPFFPQGLAHLSTITLSDARNFLLEYLIQGLPLRDMHLRDAIIAAMRMDLDVISGDKDNYLVEYLNKLSALCLTPIHDLDNKAFMKISSSSVTKALTKILIEELVRRQSTVSCIMSLENGLNILLKSIGHSTKREEDLMELVQKDEWKRRTLSYFLDKRTIRLISGASLIFSAPKVQWIQTFENLCAATKAHDDDNSLEMIEILLLGCIGSRWRSLIEYFMSVSSDSLGTLEQYHEVCNLLPERHQESPSEETNDSKEKAIVEYMTSMLDGQVHQLWKLSPVLSAVAIPSWSSLFRSYLSALDCQLKGESSIISLCSCLQHKRDHVDCEVAERIWCLYMYQVRK